MKIIESKYLISRSGTYLVTDFSVFSANNMLQRIENRICELYFCTNCFQFTETQACDTLLKEFYVNLSKIKKCK